MSKLPLKDNEASNTLWGSLISGLLGALGGNETQSKLFRRVGLPLFIAGGAYQHLHSWLMLALLSMGAVMTLGYGIPDETDSGSPLGRFFYACFKQNRLWANVFTRGVVGALLSLSLCPIPIYNHNWLLWGIGSGIITGVFAGLSWRDLGSFKYQHTTLTLSEFVPYATLGLVAFTLIYF